MAKHASRKLAAIMFTDMVGYTALMQEDETRAKRDRDRHRKVLHKFIDEHQGNILQYYGDGTLTIFDSSIEAVKASLEIQLEFQKEPRIPIRIGIHTGDIVQDEEGVYGDGVNLASRIESKCVPGSVFVSERVFDDIKNHPQFHLGSMGLFDLRHVRKPVEIFALLNEGLVLPDKRKIRAEEGSPTKTLAVMPFLNMSNDPENEYFSDGITEELINALAKVEGLQVTSRTSSFSLKGKDLDVRKIGSELNVHNILEGSVRKVGQKVRITAQLINSSDGYHVWSDAYDGDLEDIFALQDDIAKRIANTLREKLNPDDLDESLVTPSTQNLEAYNLYLMGLYYLNKWTIPNVFRAIQYFENTIDLEPRFALAHSGLGGCYSLLGATGQMNSKEAYTNARKAASRALKLDQNLLEAHQVTAAVQFFFEWNFDEGLRWLMKARKINLNEPAISSGFALFHLIHQEFEKSIEELNKALRVDPLSLNHNRTLADAYYFARRYDEAIQQYDRTLELDASFKPALEFKGWAYLFKGDIAAALNIFTNLGEETTHNLKPLTALGYAHSVSGNTAKARDCLNDLLNAHQELSGVSMSIDFATLYTGLGEIDKAFEYLEKCMDERYGAMVFFNSSPIWEPLRNDPRHQDILDRIGLKNKYG